MAVAALTETLLVHLLLSRKPKGHQRGVGRAVLDRKIATRIEIKDFEHCGLRTSELDLHTTHVHHPWQMRLMMMTAVMTMTTNLFKGAGTTTTVFSGQDH